MNLRLRKSVKSAAEFSIGNFDARFEPGASVKIEDAGFANWLLSQPQIVRADSDEDADDVVDDTTADVESVPPSRKQESEQDAIPDASEQPATGSKKKGGK